jgi:hypothetical protein
VRRYEYRVGGGRWGRMYWKELGIDGEIILKLIFENRMEQVHILN